MPYLIDALIEASTYNEFATDVNAFWGLGNGNSGYGQTPLASVDVDDNVRSAEWKALRNAIDDSNIHQGVNASVAASANIPASADFDIGAVVRAYSGESGRWNLPVNISVVNAGRLDVSGSQVAILGSQLVSRRSTAWSVQLIHEFRIEFDTEDNARHFFNSGGQIQITGNRTFYLRC
jgi:hypothetical protein